tara:strand:+ start:1232 stop:1675 length:444 start_codon:yes stop_codon:yes gene_type:complete
MQINTKTIFIGLGILAVGAVAAIIIKKRKSKKDFTMPPTEEYTDPNATADPPKGRVTPEWSPATSATALRDALDGWWTGTDNDLFWGTAESLTQDQRMQVQTYFNANLGEGSSLCEWMEGDMTWGDETKALALFGHTACTLCWSACP